MTIKAPEMLSEDDYVKRCLQCEFLHQKEERKISSAPAFYSICTHLNSEEYSKVIIAGKEILSQFADFDLPYIWIAKAYRANKQYNDAKAILSEGLSKSKRKILLLTDMGQIECDLGNIEAALYWWSQALAGLSLNPIDCGTYLFLGAVAEGVDHKRIAQRFLNWADILFRSSGCCHIRLDPEKEKSIVDLVTKTNIEVIKRVLEGLNRIYYF